ncbi:ABC transporter substrate-binding protein [Amycolatopsis acidiphila]|nr:ABC transporter substrate-binding protein [Amycolatopsis acidiphila]UIJ60418.1 ABC transporter substrate-binding protein [Amycolatopsis acidiphila]
MGPESHNRWTAADRVQWRLDRRSLLRVGAMAGAGLALGATGLTACGTGAGPSGGAAARPPAKPTGVLRVAALEPDNLDPALSSGSGIVLIGNNVYEALLRFRGDSADVEGALAESVQSSADAREWTFRLKKGITFHDGSPLTSSAVRSSYEYFARQKGPFTALIPTGAVYDDSDPDVFRVVLKNPFPDMQRNATFISIISPKLLAAGPGAVAKTPVGTGPFKFVSYTAAQSLLFEANTNYRGPGPYLERIEMPIIPDPVARVAALRSGGVDLITKVAPTDAASLRGNRSLSVQDSALWSAVQLIFFLGSAPANNLQIRQAIAHSIDKDAIVRSILGGSGQPANSFVPPGVYGYATPRTQYAYDVQKAKDLVAESGLSGPVELGVIWAPELGPNIDRVAQAVSAMAQKVGIDLRVQQKSVSAIAKEINSSTKEDQAVCGSLQWLNGGPFHFTTNYLKTVSGFSALDDLNGQLVTTPDGPRRLEILATMQELVAEQVPAVPLYVQSNIIALKNSVRGFVSPKSGYLRLGEVYNAA